MLPHAHCRLSFSFSMNFSSLKFSMFCCLPWTRAKDFSLFGYAHAAMKSNILPPHFLCPFCQPRSHHQVKHFTPLYTPTFRSEGLFLRSFGNPLLLRWRTLSTGSLAGQANLSQQNPAIHWQNSLQAKTLLAYWSLNLKVCFMHIKLQAANCRKQNFPKSLTGLWRVHYSRQDFLMLKAHNFKRIAAKWLYIPMKKSNTLSCN